MEAESLQAVVPFSVLLIGCVPLVPQTTVSLDDKFLREVQEVGTNNSTVQGLEFELKLGKRWSLN
jgi:hypothetical protein